MLIIIEYSLKSLINLIKHYKQRKRIWYKIVNGSLKIYLWEGITP